MNNEQQFMDSLRTAINRGNGKVPSKSIHPELFTKLDKTRILDNIKKRSYSEKQNLIEILQENCEGLHIDLHRAETEREAEDITVEIIRKKEPEFSHNRHVIVHDHPDIAALQLWKRFNRESVSVHTAFTADTDALEKTLASYIGITAPSIAVADSATLFQLTSPGCPRSTSLVPSIHIALVRTSNLVANLEEGYALLEKRAPKESFVFISGPSKTADIEAHLVLGAHGPRELHLILLDDIEQEPVVEEATVSELHEGEEVVQPQDDEAGAQEKQITEETEDEEKAVPDTDDGEPAGK